MVAVTVILATIVGTFVLGSTGDSARGDPLVEFQQSQDGRTVVLTHAGGDTLDGEAVYVVSDSDGWLGNYAGTDGQACDTPISTVKPGTECQISGAPGGAISIVWRSNGHSATLFRGRVSDDGSPLTPTATPTPAPTPTATPTPTPTPTPAPSPSVGGYTLRDTSENSNTNYELIYDIDGTSRFDHLEVTFDNRNNDWGDATRSASAERGTVTFSQGGQQGATYDITIRVFDTDGTVTDTVSVTDTADGSSQSSGDLTESDSPSFTGTVIDDIGGDEANYEVSYNVSGRPKFGSVRVQYTNLDSGGADATYTSADPRHNIDSYADASFGGTSGDEYRIRIELLDTDGVVVDERVVTDVADGTDPSGNADLTRPSSPTLSSYSVKDTTKNNNGKFSVQYRISDPNSDFSQVEAIFRNTDNSWATETKSSSNTGGTLRYNAGGVGGDRYSITLRVLDDDGIVVDEVTVTDTADGTNP